MSATPSPQSRRPHRRRTVAALAVLALAAAAAIAISPVGRVGADLGRCGIPAEWSSLAGPLPHTAARLAAGGPLTIVALGSSSTAGTGATSRDRSYPSRLSAALRARFPGVAIRVLNRGVGGEIAPQMLARLDRDVLAEKPDLVIWQLGTNSVLHDLDTAIDIEAARAGIARIKAAGADVMLMDLQYAPRVLLHPGYRAMLSGLAAVARSEEVPLFRRFALMRRWAEDGQMTLPAMLARDRLHMSDTSYDCLARQVARSIVSTAAPRS